jgi:hypothetical protein
MCRSRVGTPIMVDGVLYIRAVHGGGTVVGVAGTESTELTLRIA